MNPIIEPKTHYSSARLREKLSVNSDAKQTRLKPIPKPDISMVVEEQKRRDREAEMKAMQKAYAKHILSELDLVKITLHQDPMFILTQNYEKACRGIEQWLRSRHKTLDNSKGIVLWGAPGTGKTSICEAITHQKVRVIEMVDMDKILDDYLSKDGPSSKYYKTNEYSHIWENHTIKRDCGLIINDVGSERITGQVNNFGTVQIPAFSYWVCAMEPLFKKNPHLMNHFIITTNLSEDNLFEIYHDRVMSRLRMYFNFVHIGFDGKSPLEGDMRNPANRKRYEK